MATGILRDPCFQEQKTYILAHGSSGTPPLPYCFMLSGLDAADLPAPVKTALHTSTPLNVNLFQKHRDPSPK